MPGKSLTEIKAAELAEIRERMAAEKAERSERLRLDVRRRDLWWYIGRWTRRPRRWFSRGIDRWTPRLERIGKWIAAMALVIGGLVKLVHDLRATAVAPAELPKTGVASTSVDRVPRPTPPKP